MKKRNKGLSLLVGLCATSSLALTQCDDITTGQPGEPTGPIQVTRLTLIDTTSRDANVFTDTSAPTDCSAGSAMAASDACQNNPMKDMFGTKKSPPTPDSGQGIRIVFDRLPLLWKGMDLQLVKQPAPNLPPTAVTFNPATAGVMDVVCDDPGCGVPPVVKDVDLSGSALSPDPTSFAYGPALTMSADVGTDPLAALEPNSNYHVKLDPGLSGRIPSETVQLDATATALLKFHTEPFKVLQVGIGDVGQSGSDPFVYKDGGTTFTADGVASNGVVAVHLNAPIDPSTLKDTTVTATASGAMVPVKVSLNLSVTDPKTMAVSCTAGDQRTLYIYPTGMDWGAAGMVTINLQGADVKDLSQLANHPAGMGRNSLSSAITITATNTGTKADAKYVGPTSDLVGCDPNVMNPDMAAGSSDMATGKADGGADGGKDM